MDATPAERADEAERIFFRALVERQSGRTVDIEALCAAHAGCAPLLRELHSHWQLLREGTGGQQACASVGSRLRERHGVEAESDISLQGGPEPGPDPSSEVLARLSSRRGSLTRYRLEGEVARGGMGAILRVWDEDLRRHLAMKVVLSHGEPWKAGETPPVPVTTLARFLEEAQVTGQLDHPGIVPVHELGLDKEGGVYFTMKLVKGRTLGTVFDELASGTGGWTQARVLGLILKVCEALAYAHDKGVIHRDLKPANVMVGRFGEVYVMDWGLAKILGRADSRDLRVRSEPNLTTTELRSDRRERFGTSPDSPIVTMDGDVVGTPAYMSPEQAMGKVDEMSPASDVYALGAMLYHLVAGHMPYVPPYAAANNYAVWQRVQEGPPKPLHEVAPNAPAELIAICERAMARERSARYGSIADMAEDLSAFLERRVVRAYETGAWAEARKWVQRNKSLGAALVAAFLLLAVGLTASLVLKARSDRNAALAASSQAATQEKQDALWAMTDSFMRSLLLPEGLSIVERSAWCDSPPDTGKMKPMGAIERITVHHSGEYLSLDASNFLMPGDVVASLRSIRDAHRARSDYWDIGYHFAVSPDGRVWECRSLDFQGAHVGGRGNVGNVGVLVLGDFAEQFPTPQQFVALTLLTRSLQEEHSIGAEGVGLHSDLTETSCPGANLRELLRKLTHAVDVPAAGTALSLVHTQLGRPIPGGPGPGSEGLGARVPGRLPPLPDLAKHGGAAIDLESVRVFFLPEEALFGVQDPQELKPQARRALLELGGAIPRNASVWIAAHGEDPASLGASPMEHLARCSVRAVQVLEFVVEEGLVYDDMAVVSAHLGESPWVARHAPPLSGPGIEIFAATDSRHARPPYAQGTRQALELSFPVGGSSPDAHSVARMGSVVDQELAAGSPRALLVLGHSDATYPDADRVAAGLWSPFPRLPRSNREISLALALRGLELVVQRCPRVPRAVGVVGHGPHAPLVGSDTDAERARNRRVEWILNGE